MKMHGTKSRFGDWVGGAGCGHLPTVEGVAKLYTQGNESMRVFLVDDSPQVLDRLKSTLVSLDGIEVIGSAGDLPDALQVIRTSRPDLVILDLRLPSGSGIKVLQMIKQENLGVDVVVLTNYAFPQYRQKCTEAGAYAFLDKSTDFAKVPQVITTLAELHEKTRRGFPPGKLPSPSEPKLRVG
jgi:DNA-binding NarL/FixJ family response regulator